MRQKTVILLITYLCLVLLLPLGYLVTRPSDFSGKERRVLTDTVRVTPKAIASGAMMRDTENYLADQIPQRDLLLGLKSEGLKGLGMNDNERVIYGNGYLLDRYAFNDDQFEINLQAIQNFADKLKGPAVRLLAIPRVDTLVPEIRPALYDDPTEEDLRTRLNTLRGVDVLDFAGYLQTLTDDIPGYVLEHELFYKTDHHWTQEGARHGAELFLKAEGIKAMPYELTLKTNTFRGTTYAKSGLLDAPFENLYAIEPAANPNLNEMLPVLDAEGDVVQQGIYDSAALEGYDPYLFFGDNIPYFKVVNENALTERNLLVFKDSFFNSLLPYLTPYYQTIEVVDLRFYKKELNPLVDGLGEEDTILLCYRMLGMDGPLEALSFLR